LAGGIDSSESIPGLHKRLQIQLWRNYAIVEGMAYEAINGARINPKQRKLEKTGLKGKSPAIYSN
jgi:hypothetical protein